VKGRSAKEKKKRRKKDKRAGCGVAPRVHEQKDARGFKKR
jgi:hypothetical protein